MKINVLFLMFLLLAINASAISVGEGIAQEIYTKNTPQTYIAQKNEMLVIHPIKTNITYFVLIKDFQYMLRQGSGFNKGGNNTNHDLVMTTLEYDGHTLWDVNDSVGSIIEFNNDTFQFKALYSYEDVLVFNITEISKQAIHPNQEISTPFAIILVSVILVVFMMLETYININNWNKEYEKRKKDDKKKDKLQ